MRGALPLLLAAALAAGEADAVRVVCADGAQLEQHWNASLFGQVWGEPGLAPLRQRVDAWLAQVKRDSGVDLAAAARAARGIQLRFLDIDDSRQARWAVQADLGPQAPQVARRLAAAEGSARPLAITGADEAWSLSRQVLARFGGIVGFGRPGALLPLPPPPAPAGDIAVRIETGGLLGMLRGSLEPAQAAQAGALLDLLARRWRSVALEAALDPAGVTWSGRFEGDVSGLKPADRALLERMPGTASTVQLIGCDGAAWWRAWGDELVAALDPLLHDGQSRGAAATLADLQAATAALGVAVDLPALIQGTVGTIALVQTPGVPFPGFTILVPRSAALDALVAGLCQRLGCRQPDEGGYALLPIPDLPVAIQLARDRGHWLIGTDALLASTWGGGAAGGFTATAMGRELLTTAPAQACILGANDLAPSLRMALGPVNLALGEVRGMSAAERQAVIVALVRIAALLPPGMHWGEAAPGRLDLRGRGGDVLWVALPAVIAAIAIPNLLESRVTANEAAAAATLKSGVFASQVQFQAGGYQDADGDGVGEYGLLSELSGRRAVGTIEAGKLQFLGGPLARGDVANGYRYAGYLPDGAGGAIAEPAEAGARPAQARVDDQERLWVAYAWPQSLETGRRMFAIDQIGQVYVRPWDGEAPAWSSLYAGGAWGGKAVWELYRR